MKKIEVTIWTSSGTTRTGFQNPPYLTAAWARVPWRPTCFFATLWEFTIISKEAIEKSCQPPLHWEGSAVTVLLLSFIHALCLCPFSSLNTIYQLFFFLMGTYWDLFFCFFFLMGGSFPGGSGGKKSACNAEDLGLIPGLGKIHGEGNGYLLQ